MKKILFIIGLLMSVTAYASTWDSYLLNREALSSMKAENFSESLQEILRALESDPLNPKLHLNMGMALLGMGEPEKAARAFAAAGRLASNVGEKYVALFNEAYCLGESKQIEKALETYQKALSIKPDSEEIKVNIELLLAAQSQQGKGEGQGKPQQNGDQQKKDQNNQGQGQQEPQPEKPQRKKPKPFKSEELTSSDVKKILEELKSQEQKIRAKEYEKGPKERPNGKDW